MNRQPPFKKVNVRLTPNNQPSQGFFSATNFPVINFVLGSSPGMLMTDTLKLNYTFEILDQAGNPPANTPSSNAVPNTNGVTISSKVGSASAIDQVHIQTMNGRNLETILSYNRYLATSIPNASNQFDFVNSMGGTDPLFSTKSVGGARQANVPTEVSVPIKTGFFSNKAIPLDQKGIHGLQLSIQLQQNANVISPYSVITQENNGLQTTNLQSATLAANYAYRYSNVTLTYSVLVPNDEVYSAMPSNGTLVFNSITSMASTLLTSDTTLTMRLGLKNLISATHSLIPAVHLNNVQQDGMKLARLSNNPTATTQGTTANLATIRYFKGGQNFPIQATLDSEQQVDNPQASIMKPALNSVILFEDGEHQMMNPQTNTEGLNNLTGFNVGAKGLNINEIPDPDSNFILGIATDSGGQGVNYSREDYAVRLQSNLNGRTPQQFYSFFRARQVLSYSPTGVVVQE